MPEWKETLLKVFSSSDFVDYGPLEQRSSRFWKIPRSYIEQREYECAWWEVHGFFETGTRDEKDALDSCFNVKIFVPLSEEQRRTVLDFVRGIPVSSNEGAGWSLLNPCTNDVPLAKRSASAVSPGMVTAGSSRSCAS